MPAANNGSSPISGSIPYLLILISISTLISFLYVYFNEGFGQGDIIPFAFSTTILACNFPFIGKPLQKAFF